MRGHSPIPRWGLVLMSLAYWTPEMGADTWDWPRTFEVISENGSHLARVEPAVRYGPDPKLRHPRLTVFSIQGDQTNVSWTTTLSNRTSPLNAFVSNDGTRVVTLDNHGNMGYGNEVLAFYAPTGQVKAYTLEAAFTNILGNRRSFFEVKLNGLMKNLAQYPTFAPVAGFYERNIASPMVSSRDFFPHSVSSRFWRYHSLILLDEDAHPPTFGIWVDWAREWHLWNLVDGRPLKVQGRLLHRWNDKGREWALPWFEEPDLPPEESPEGDRAEWTRIYYRMTAMRYLATLKDPQDRTWMEKALVSNGRDGSNFPLLQVEADRALAVWSGSTHDFKDLDYHHSRKSMPLFFLGTLELTMEFPEDEEVEGQLYIYVLPANTAEDEWEDSPNAWKIGWPVSGGWTRPNGNRVTLPEELVTGGRYWIKAVWDRTPPFKYDLRNRIKANAWKRQPKLMAPSPGDYESRGREIFQLKAGERLRFTIPCKQPVAGNR